MFPVNTVSIARYKFFPSVLPTLLKLKVQTQHQDNFWESLLMTKSTVYFKVSIGVGLNSKEEGM